MRAFGAGDRHNEASSQNSVTRVPGPFGMLCALSAISKECPVVCWSSNPTLPTLSSVLREQLDTCILGQIKTLSMDAEQHSAFVQATSILVYVLAIPRSATGTMWGIFYTGLLHADHVLNPLNSLWP